MKELEAGRYTNALQSTSLAEVKASECLLNVRYLPVSL